MAGIQVLLWCFVLDVLGHSLHNFSCNTFEKLEFLEINKSSAFSSQTPGQR